MLPIPDLEKLRRFCQKSQDFHAEPIEQTLFSIGGRGYYENPTSDLLAFFMAEGAHGLSEVFLGGFLDCMGFDKNLVQEMLSEPTLIERERKTENGNRLDLRIRGKDWALVIENKIRHWLANDFNHYRSSTEIWARAHRIERDKVHFAILSPTGQVTDDEIWKPVQYLKFIDRATERLNALPVPSERSKSKWHVFAEDFLIHLKQETCMKELDQDTIKFIESNFINFPAIQRIKNEYMHHLWNILHFQLGENSQKKLKLSWKNNYFLIGGQNWENWQLGLSGPNHLALDSDGLLLVRVWCKSDTVDLDCKHKKHFSEYEQTGMDNSFIEYQRTFDSTESALEEIHRLAECLLDPIR